MITKTTFAVGVLITGLMAGTAVAQTEMRIGMVTINDPQHQFTNKYGEEIVKRTGGKIKVRVFPAAQLGKIPRQLENLKIGSQAGFVSPPGFLSGMNRAFQAPDAPGLFKSFWHAHNTFTDPAFRGKYLNLADKHGIVGAAIFNYGPTSIASLKPIRSLADMKGLKIRVLATPMESKLAKVLGMTGVPMPYSEVLPALQRKTIDGCRSSIVVMGASKFFTTTKYITLIESGTIPSALWVSKRWLAKLPKKQQDIVMQTGRDLEIWAGRNAARLNGEAEALWKKNGAEVIRLSAMDQTIITNQLAPLGDEFLATSADTRDMYKVLKSVLKTASTTAP
ncbi:MAG: TRAP transporter substrate-binding protein [Proteobacteria bacterium]|nr:TRAP transporter substrate-binding protein [Pseudomonadota bacterium]